MLKIGDTKESGKKKKKKKTLNLKALKRELQRPPPKKRGGALSKYKFTFLGGINPFSRLM